MDIRLDIGVVPQPFVIGHNHGIAGGGNHGGDHDLRIVFGPVQVIQIAGGGIGTVRFGAMLKHEDRHRRSAADERFRQDQQAGHGKGLAIRTDCLIGDLLHLQAITDTREKSAEATGKVLPIPAFQHSRTRMNLNRSRPPGAKG